MLKIAIVVLADTDTLEGMGRVSNALMTLKEAVENNDEYHFIFEGAGVRWISELEKKDNKLHPLYTDVKKYITGACGYCSEAFGVKSAVEKVGIPMISEYNGHPSMRKLIIEGFNIITF